MSDDVGADGGEEAEQHHVLVEPGVHAELLDAAQAGKIQINQVKKRFGVQQFIKGERSEPAV